MSVECVSYTLTNGADTVRSQHVAHLAPDQRPEGTQLMWPAAEHTARADDSSQRKTADTGPGLARAIEIRTTRLWRRPALQLTSRVLPSTTGILANGTHVILGGRPVGTAAGRDETSIDLERATPSMEERQAEEDIDTKRPTVETSADPPDGQWKRLAEDDCTGGSPLLRHPDLAAARG